MRDAFAAMLRNDKADLAALLVLPVLFFAAALALRHAGGPFWDWHVVDPSYFYLFDSLHVARLTPPGHSYHPGVPVQLIGGIVLRLAHPLASGDALAARVLDDPEAHIRLISNVLLALNACAILAAGAAARALTGNLALALFLQAGPFLSMVILKNAYHAKPESLLIATALALSVAVLATGYGKKETDTSYRPAVAFGIIAGFGVATKLTAAPIFLLPIFLLGGVRGIAVYGLAAAAAFAVFLVPALPNIPRAADFALTTLTHAGAYGGGAKGVIDFAVYPRAVVSVASRPIVHLQLVFGAAALAIAFWRRRRGLPVPGFETRALAGLTLAVAAQVLAVAKQPTANYMVPAYMQLPLAAILFYRFVAGLSLGGAVLRRRAAVGVAVVLGAVVVLQGTAVRREYRDLAEKRMYARSIDDGRFAACARIYFFPASGRSFALFLGNWWTGSRFGDAVAARVPANDLWFEQNTMDLRDAHGSRDLAPVLAESPCVFMRGGSSRPILAFFARHAPGFAFDSSCTRRDETIFTRGVDCRGNLVPKAQN